MENVKGYDVGVLRKLFEHLYIIETILLCPTQFGWVSCRHILANHIPYKITCLTHTM